MTAKLPNTEAMTTPLSEIYYPDSDEQPLANNTEHFDWIVKIQQNLDSLLANDFVSSDLFWYPIEGRPDVSVAADVMVAIGRPKGDRLFYKQWLENDIAPQVVFEILSPSNTQKEMYKKLLFFERHGVQEYYLYDTETFEVSGFKRGEFGLTLISEMVGWVSPALKIRFEMANEELQLFRPDGSPFLSYQESEERAESAEERANKLAEKLKSLGIDPDQI